MANEVSLQYFWPDGQRLIIRVEADNAFPDALDQARAAARRSFREAMADLMGVESDIDLPEVD